jgi:hypothetical protein
MTPFIAAYITTNGKEWDRPLCIEDSISKCKQRFCDWYQNVDYKDCSVRYASVTVVERDEVKE